jgi:hypothetical protein
VNSGVEKNARQKKAPLQSRSDIKIIGSAVSLNLSRVHIRIAKFASKHIALLKFADFFN